MIWGLIILYAFSVFNLLMGAHEHGKPKTGNHNFWIITVANLLQLVLIWWALGWRFF
jgi:uncharacterized membrane protein